MLLASTFIQCRKDEPIPFCEQFPDQCVEMERIKDHYYFKKGSWWVYEEQNTGAIDSQWVVDSWSNLCDFELTINNSLNNYNIIYWDKVLTNGQNCGYVDKSETSAFVRLNKTKPGDYVGQLNLAGFFYKKGDSVYNYVSSISNNQSRLVNIYPEMHIGNYNYKDVLEFYLEVDPIENLQQTKYFYASGVGLVKRELIDSNQTWLLKKYNVVQ